MATQKPKKSNVAVTRQVLAGLPFAVALSEEARSRVLRAIVSGYRQGWDAERILQSVRAVLERYLPALANALGDAQGAAWITAVGKVVKALPQSQVDNILTAPATLTPQDTAVLRELRRNFPLTADAAKWLKRLPVVTRGELLAVSKSAQQEIFSVAGFQSDELVAKIRDVLYETIVEGPSLGEFRERISNELQTGLLSDQHAETVYRTTVQSAFSEGRRQMEANPVVSATFPYKEYLAIHDGRVRDEHLALEKLGLNGTAVYRADDPMWRFFDPPWDFNCRCSVNLLTIRKAAQKGVREAQEWLRTGKPPEQPEWRLDFIKFRPDEAWRRST